MGRPETDIDPGQGPVQRFAFELRKLRQETGGITYRQMARQVEFSVTALSRAAAGEQLPSLPVALAYVTVCGGDPDEWEQRWRAAAREEAQRISGTADDGRPPPYRGLARFDVGDEHLFFGRGDLADDLARTATEHRVVAVVGPSGSGKSSLLRAGLVPRLRSLTGPARQPEAIRILTPGEHPVRTREDVLTPAPGDGDTWLIVDQFEEVFTLCHDPVERADFLTRLLAATEPGSGLRVVLGVRGDFYGRCLALPGLAAAVRGSSVPVGPMAADELRAVIVKPAQADGLIVERALTDRLIKEVSQEPGGLPLLSHALLETWRRRHGRTLTLRAYEAAGGIHGAIAQTAESLYTQLTPDQAAAARRILLRLVTPGEGAPDTRCPLPRTSLGGGDATTAEVALEHLARARLVTVDDHTVDLAHEALITAWPRLRQWIDDDRQRLVVRRKMTQAAADWDGLDRDQAALYRGTLLATADDLLGSEGRRGELSELEQDFLTASRAERDRVRARKARATRRLRGLTATLALLLALSLTAGVIAWRESEDNDRRRVRAEAQRVAAVAEKARSSDPRLAMRLSVAAWRIADTAETRSAVLGAVGQKERDVFAVPPGDGQFDPVVSADGRAVVAQRGKRLVVEDTVSHKSRSVPVREDMWGAAVSAGGKMVAAQAESGPTMLWDMATGRRLGKPLATASGDFEFTPDGRTLLARGERDLDGAPSGQRSVVELWDVRRQILLSRRSMSADAVVGSDGRHLAWCPSMEKGPLRLWDTRTGRFRELLGGRPTSPCVGGPPVFTQGAMAVNTGSEIRRWDVKTGERLPAYGSPDGGSLAEGAGPPRTGPSDSLLDDVGDSPRIQRFTLSDDGRLAAAVTDGSLVVWRTDRPRQPVWRHTPADDYVMDLWLDADARQIRYLGMGGPTGTTVRSLDLGPAADIATWQSANRPTAMLSSRGDRMATIQEHGARGSVGVTGIREGSPTRHVGTVPMQRDNPLYEDDPRHLVSLSADGRLVAHGHRTSPGRGLPDEVRVRDARTRRGIATVRPGHEVLAVSLSPDGTRLATLGKETAELWNVRSGARLRMVEAEHTDARGKVTFVLSGEADGIAVRPDNELLVVTSSEGLVVRLPSGKAVTRPLSNARSLAVAFSPDGRHLAVGDSVGLVSLWDGDVRRRLHLLPASRAGGRVEQAHPVSALAFSPDGNRLATAGENGTLRLWDTATGRQIGLDQPTPGDRITSVAFAPDGQGLYAVGEHTPVRRYTVAPSEAAAEACERAAGGPSREEWQEHITEVAYRDVC
ncbi:hypothetical protein ABT390_09700 [Streptomyces aurantiacus]|uniref:HTH cro/C1-type domain-containing protein n=1 Tax=Streptomyces aurantiacus JA 4570 TaxID=1286094 RepID=S3ZN65_9ACTN|nr:hypothetical protein [Streptomyces aurantiacus]EPH44224.1 hypothetical protein STRAU_2664 [Streptomyces aurantiacus JA 4570]